MIVKPQADVFGASDSGPFYKEDGPRFESYAGGVTWARGKGYSFVASDGLPGSKSENDQLRAISDGLADSIHAADLDQSVEEPEAGFSSREQRLPVVTDEDSAATCSAACSTSTRGSQTSPTARRRASGGGLPRGVHPRAEGKLPGHRASGARRRRAPREAAARVRCHVVGQAMEGRPRRAQEEGAASTRSGDTPH